MAVNPMMDGARTAAGTLSAVSSGIQAGMNGLAHAAQEIAELNATRPAPDAGGAEQALVDLRLYQRRVEASAVVLQTADAAVGFLLDIHA
ncbi:MAG TPA: flagellar biosynthesis protein FlgE [Pseudomonadales bacterium]